MSGNNHSRMLSAAFVGNPNAGKSTLVNTLSGKDFKTGNWHGVTVEAASAVCRVGGRKFSATDLPGLYTLKGGGAEEGVAEKFLLRGDYFAAVLVVEAKNLPRALRLFCEMTALGKKMVVFVNFRSRFYRRGGRIDEAKLSSVLGVPVVAGEASDKACAERLVSALFSSAAPPKKSSYEKLLSEIKRTSAYLPESRSPAAERLAENPFFCYPVFALTLFSCFFLAFGEGGPGDLISGLISRLFTLFGEFTGGFLRGRVTDFLCDLVSVGVIGGVGAVAGFIPQIAVMTLCTELLDRSGYVSRLAVATDRAMSFFGLNGKAVYVLLGGFGCTAVAAVAAKGIEDVHVRRRAVLALPFVSCSAKTPVYALFAKYAFGALTPAVMTAVWFFSAVFSLLHASLVYKTVERTKPKSLVFEIADVIFPPLRPVFKSVLNTVKNFVVRLGTVVVITSVALFILGGVTSSGYSGGMSDDSLMAYVGKLAALPFSPLGLGDWRYGAALIGGVFAKEGIASALALYFPGGLGLSFAQGFALTAFVYAYTPCVSALAAISSAIGGRYAVLSALWQAAVALAAAYLCFFALV